jgi:hypothetical protein
MSHPADSSMKSGSDDKIGPKFARSNIGDILADKSDMPQSVLNGDDDPGLAYQVVMLRDRLQLAQHIISGLRAESEQEKLVTCFHVDLFFILNQT